MMAHVVDSVTIKGLRLTHFHQLQTILNNHQQWGGYYGRKDYWYNRMDDLIEWCDMIVDILDDPDVRIAPKIED